MIVYSDEPNLTAISAAYAGARFLDETAAVRPDLIPGNWRDLIETDPDNFEMGDPGICVIGHLGHHNGMRYATMAASLGLEIRPSEGNGEIVRLGFDISGYTPWRHDELTAAWRTVLADTDAFNPTPAAAAA